MLSKQVTVTLVEDHQILSRLMGKWINDQRGYVLAGTAADGESGLQLCLRTQPALVLVDIELPKIDGLELARTLLEQLPHTRLLAISGLVDPHTVWRVTQSGVHGYVEKSQDPEVLAEAMRIVIHGGNYFSPSFIHVKEQWLSRTDSFQKITSKREQEVLIHLVKGWDDKQVGKAMQISAATVATHRKNLRIKLGLHNDRDLVGYARRWGLDVTIQRSASP